MIRTLLPLAVLASAGCTQQRSVAELPAAPAGACTSDGLASLLGKQRGDAAAADAMRLSGARTLRWIEPGMAVTMDYREDRLNLHLSADGKIESARCG
ncbi:I78 family peptidase inhibitor [Sphingomonas sp. S2-65]|uniref:I78 family peptidase inhibitor n=1 Tax=Sphingomonas sp. S2-65 TaxID=2903960 RepID=UPI001EED8E20|nr:I78 family peptidase inhibitor [Sphingomonas sp. S2-65]UYY58996.1 I78 family peptidase inhibitor [Sphingomonas sp. S2-65]